jgi:DGQHR domain-containing protein
MSYQIPALKFVQAEHPMYLAVIPYRYLITPAAVNAVKVGSDSEKLYKVDRWEPWDKAKGGSPDDAFGPKAGYQRREDENHALGFVEYILGQYEQRDEREVEGEGDAGVEEETTTDQVPEEESYKIPEMVPVTGILNTRTKGLLKFSPVKGQHEDDAPSSVGTLEYPDSWLHGKPIFWVVDMQHRLKGMELALRDTTGQFSTEQKEFLLHYSLPVCITDGLDMFAETELFYTINTAAKKVPTSLAYMLINVQLFKQEPGRSERLRRRLQIHGTVHRARAALLAYYLNYTDGPWEGRIHLPNEDSTPTQVVAHNSVMTSLSPFMAEMGKSLTDQEAVTTVNNLWKGIALALPAEFVKPDQSAIQQGAGLFAFNRYFLNSQVAALGPKATPAEWRAALAGIETLPKYAGMSYWNVGNDRGATQYSSGKGFKILAGIIKKQLTVKPVRERLENYLAGV